MMTISRRSSSTFPAVWRSARTTRDSTPPSVSLVVAEPEHGTPLASAITSLPTCRPTIASSSNSLSLKNMIPPSSGHGVSTQLNDTQGQTAEPASHSDTITAAADPPPPPPSSSTTDSPRRTTEELANVPVPEPPPITNPASSSSWFGSLARRKETSVSAKDPPSFTPPAETPPPPPPPKTLPIIDNSPPQQVIQVPVLLPTPTPPAPVPAKRWFSSSSAPPRIPEPTPTKHDTLQSSSSTSLPSPPPDDTLQSSSSTSLPLPPPPTSTPAAAPKNDNNNENDNVTNTATTRDLSTPTGRFSISIPFLGRLKMPLDQAVAAAAVARDTSANDSPTLQIPANDSTTITVNNNQPQGPETVTPSSSPGEEPVPDITQTPYPGDSITSEDNKSVKDREVSSPSSWLGYIGFKSSDVPKQASTQSVSATTDTAKPIVEQPPTPAVEPQSDVEPNNPDALIPYTEAVNHDARPGKISAGQNSAWYAPWTWNASSTPDSSASNPVDSVDSTGESPSEAVAQKEESVVNESPSTAGPPSEQSNPVQSSISTNKSAWSSFFLAKALSMKTITDKDENGMEVMYIDEVDDHSELPTSVSDNNSVKNRYEPLDAKSTTTTRPPTPPASPSTPTESAKRDAAKINAKRPASPAPSKKSRASSPPKTPPPNLILPTWEDTFHCPPRSILPSPNTSRFFKAIKAVSGVLFPLEGDQTGSRKGKERQFRDFGKALPRAREVMETGRQSDVLKGCKRVVVIGIHGWFPGTVVRTVFGQPTGTSTKFVNMMVQAIEAFQETHNVKLQKITKIPLEGEGTIERRVDKLYQALLSNVVWMDDLHDADAIFFATHSQGSIVSTHLLDRLIRDQHIKTQRNIDALVAADSVSAAGVGVTRVPILRAQKVCCLCVCGIHLGPLRYLRTSSVVLPYIQYFESLAARELFDFQSTETNVSKEYVNALRNTVDHGIKMVYIASLNDQVVPVCSALFTAARHPLILRALYIDGDAYSSSDFLSKLLVLLLRVLNTGLSDSGLLAHLSELTAGSLTGVGHSTAYEESACYSLAVKYMFLTDDGLESHPELVLESFDATTEQNDYEIPWSLRDLIADEHVAHFFSAEIGALRDAFREWHPKTAILRDVKRKLQPIQRLPASSSKL